MFYTIYKVTNQINGKFYIGSHKTKDLDDGYMGSGKYLKYAQEKYGIENFKKEVLFVFETAEEMYAKEAEIVNEEFLATENTYNLKVGGFGGFDYINSNPDAFLTEKRLNSLMTNSERRERWIIKYNSSADFRDLIRSNLAKGKQVQRLKYPQGTFKDKTHSESAKQAIGRKNAEHQRGCGNSQYGTKWICNIPLQENRKIPKIESVPEGWILGRNKWKSSTNS